MRRLCPGATTEGVAKLASKNALPSKDAVPLEATQHAPRKAACVERTPRSKAVDGRGLVPWRPWSPSGPSRPTPAEPLSPLSPGFPAKRIDIAVFRIRKASARRHGPRGAAWPWLFTDGRHTEAGPHGTGSVGCDTVTPATRLARVAAAVPWSSGVSGRRRWQPRARPPWVSRLQQAPAHELARGVQRPLTVRVQPSASHSFRLRGPCH